MTFNVYVIHVKATDPDPVPTTVSNLVTRVCDLYRFMGVTDANLTVKHFRNSKIVTGILYCSPSPKVCIDFSDKTKIRVETTNVTLEPIF